MLRCEICSNKYENQKQLLKHIEKCCYEKNKNERRSVISQRIEDRSTNSRQPEDRSTRQIEDRSARHSKIENRIEDRSTDSRRKEPIRSTDSRSVLYTQKKKTYLDDLPEVSLFNQRKESNNMFDISSMFMQAKETYDQKLQNSVNQIDNLKNIVQDLEGSIHQKTKLLEKIQNQDSEEIKEYKNQIVKMFDENSHLRSEVSTYKSNHDSLQEKVRIQEIELKSTREKLDTTIIDARNQLDGLIKKLDENNVIYKQKLLDDNNVKMAEMKDLYDTRFIQLTTKYSEINAAYEEKLSVAAIDLKNTKQMYDGKIAEITSKYEEKMNTLRRDQTGEIIILSQQIETLRNDLVKKDAFYEKKIKTEIEASLSCAAKEYSKTFNDVETKYSKKISEFENILSSKNDTIAGLETRVKSRTKNEDDFKNLEQQLMSSNNTITQKQMEITNILQTVTTEKEITQRHKENEERMKIQMDKLQQSIETLSINYNNKLEETKREYLTEMVKYKNEIDSRKLHIEKLDQEITVLGLKIIELNDALETNKKNTQEIEKNMTTHQNENVHLRKMYSDSQSQNKSVNASIRIVTEQCENRISNITNTMEAKLKEESENKNKIIKELNDTISEMKTEIANRKNEYQKLQDTNSQFVNSLQQDLQLATSKITTLENNYISTSDHNKKLCDTISMMTNEYTKKLDSTYEDGKKSMQPSIQEKELLIQSTNQQIQDLTNKLNTKETEIQIEKNTFLQRFNEIEKSYSDKVVSLEQKYNVIISEKDSKLDLLRTASSAIPVLEEKNSFYENQIKTLNSKINENMSLINDQSDRMLKMKEEVKTKMYSLVEKEKSIEDFVKLHDSLKLNLEIKEKMVTQYESDISDLKTSLQEEYNRLKLKEDSINENKITYEKYKLELDNKDKIIYGYDSIIKTMKNSVTDELKKIKERESSLEEKYSKQLEQLREKEAGLMRTYEEKLSGMKHSLQTELEKIKIKEQELEKNKFLHDSYLADIQNKNKIILGYDSMIKNMKTMHSDEIKKMKETIVETKVVEEKPKDIKMAAVNEDRFKRLRDDALNSLNVIRGQNAELENKIKFLSESLSKKTQESIKQEEMMKSVNQELLDALNSKEDELTKRNNRISELEKLMTDLLIKKSI